MLIAYGSRCVAESFQDAPNQHYIDETATTLTPFGRAPRHYHEPATETPPYHFTMGNASAFTPLDGDPVRRTRPLSDEG